MIDNKHRKSVIDRHRAVHVMPEQTPSDQSRRTAKGAFMTKSPNIPRHSRLGELAQVTRRSKTVKITLPRTPWGDR